MGRSPPLPADADADWAWGICSPAMPLPVEEEAARWWWAGGEAA